MSRRSILQHVLDDRRLPVRLRVASEAGLGHPDAMLVYLADLETAAAFVAAFGLALAGG